MGVDLKSVINQGEIQRDTAVIDFLIEMVFIPYAIWNWKLLQLGLNRQLYFYIADVIGFEDLPFVWGMDRQVACSTTIRFCRAAGLRKVLDQVLALVQLLALKLKNRADTFQGQREAHIGRPDHSAAPSRRIEISSDRIFGYAVAGIAESTVVMEPPRKTDSFKLRVESPLSD